MCTSRVSCSISKLLRGRKKVAKFFAGFSLMASTTYGVWPFWCRLQGTERLVTRVPGGRCQLITTTGRRRLWSCCYLRRSTNPHNSGRSILHCCWSTPVDKSTTLSPWLWTIAFRVSPVTENAFIWLTIAAPSDLLLDVVRFTNVLTCL